MPPAGARQPSRNPIASRKREIIIGSGFDQGAGTHVGSGVEAGSSLGAVDGEPASVGGTSDSNTALAAVSIEGRGRPPARSPLNSMIATMRTIASAASPVPMLVEILMNE